MNDELVLLEVTSVETATSEALSELLIDVVEDGASVGFLPPLGKEDADRYWQAVIQPGVLLWIARKNEETVGTVQLHLAMKPNASHRAEVAKLMVHPKHRQNGIATLLMRKAEEAARAAGRSLLVLDTRFGDPSNRLYRSLGYVEAGRIPKYARSASGSLDDTIFYYKALKPVGT